MASPRIAVIVKRTSYRVYIEEEHDARVTQLLADGDPTVRRMLQAHKDHESTLTELRSALAGTEAQFFDGSRARIDSAFDLVVTVGGDGTLLAASHQVGPGIPILGVNSAPDFSVGFFCAAKKGTVERTIATALDGKLPGAIVSRMEVTHNGTSVHRRVLNEALFCHSCPAATSRYILQVTHTDGRTDEEEQRSSGLWVGTAAGSTGAQKSAGGRVIPLHSHDTQYVVREPYTRFGHAFRMRVGAVEPGGEITLRNKMREAKLFVDGHHIVFDVTIGDVITMGASAEPLTVLGLSREES